jgi:cytosine/adenosine deaminase-related metal-dependent hydrolase
MTTATRPWRKQRARAARQALRLCEAALPHGTGRTPGRQHRVNALTARAALRAVGLPPHLAATLRSRLRLIPEQEAEQ